jgi:hypothetical protein
MVVKSLELKSYPFMAQASLREHENQKLSFLRQQSLPRT